MVTQLTSKGTGVTLNNVAGRIMSMTPRLTRGGIVGFALTNSAITATDLVYAQHVAGGTAGSYRISVDNVSAGSCSIRIQNITGGNLSEAIGIEFVMIKGVTS